MFVDHVRFFLYGASLFLHFLDLILFFAHLLPAILLNKFLDGRLSGFLLIQELKSCFKMLAFADAG